MTTNPNPEPAGDDEIAIKTLMNWLNAQLMGPFSRGTKSLASNVQTVLTRLQRAESDKNSLTVDVATYKGVVQQQQKTIEELKGYNANARQRIAALEAALREIPTQYGGDRLKREVEILLNPEAPSATQ